MRPCVGGAKEHRVVSGQIWKAMTSGNSVTIWSPLFCGNKTGQPNWKRAPDDKFKWAPLIVIGASAAPATAVRTYFDLLELVS